MYICTHVHCLCQAMPIMVRKDWLWDFPMGLLALSIPLISKMLAAELHCTAATSAISVALAAVFWQKPLLESWALWATPP